MDNPKIPIKLTRPGKLPYIILYHNESKYRFVIDTGSTLSWTTPGVCGSMLMQPESGYDNLIMSNNETVPFIHVTLRIEPRKGTSEDFTATKFRANFACGEGSEKIAHMNEFVKYEIHGILGSDFLLDNMLKVDMANMEIAV